jgi:hypothetical protein
MNNPQDAVNPKVAYERLQQFLNLLSDAPWNSKR